MIHELEGLRLQTVGDDYYVAPGAQLVGHVILGAGASIWFNAVLRGDDACIEIGAGSNVQDASVIHCDPGVPTRVGSEVTIGHRVLLHGCVIGDGSLVGNGAIVLDGARIGRRCLVGAGALVTPGKAFADGSVIMGSPARVIRAVGEKELAMFAHGAASYRARMLRYRAGLRPDPRGSA
ncbi:MAG TPA: gamma carbonic anhydrase family protein [Steroidobacteraceae bacterium]|nr:gamma carbonic anhydrase family protein [Steroidobacteraceae bacterium]